MTGNRSVTDDDHEELEPAAPPAIPQHQQLVSTVASGGSRSLCTTEDDASSIVTNDISLVTPTSASQKTSPKSSTASSSAVQVAVRVRPILSSLESGCGSCIHVLPGRHVNDNPTTIQIGPSSGGPRFTFDEVFPTTTTQIEVFQNRVAPLVERCLEGYNATILAYGQTGSGKTHTVIGPSTCHSSPEEPSSGMIPRAVNSLFHQLQDKQQELSSNNNQQSPKHTASPSRHNSLPASMLKFPPTSPDRQTQTTTTKGNANNNNDGGITYEFQVRVQFLELYGEEIRDLLISSSTTQERLTIRDIGNDEPEVVGATSQVVESAEEALRCLTKGMLRRVTAATAMNESSSRSHAIFSILVEQTWTTATTTGTSAPGVGPQARRSKFNFVDLAGSERQKRTRAEGRRLKEGIDINKGLLVLGNVISALGDPKKRGKAFVPYRDSKLTRLLQGSLGGNHKTLMIACVSPASTNMEESLNCLRYANRAKNIQNRAIVNVDARSRMIAELKAQIQALAMDFLRAKETGDPKGGGAFSREDLVAILQGEAKTGGGKQGDSAKESSPESKATTTTQATTPRLLTPEPDQTDGFRERQHLQDVEEELTRTSDQLKRSRRETLAVEERLHLQQGEKEFYRLQLEALSNKRRNDGGGDGTSSNVTVDQLFVNRASEYEKEIHRLKDELRIARSRIVDEREPADIGAEGTFSIEKASEEMKTERERLVVIKNDLLSNSVAKNDSPKTPHSHDTPHSQTSPSDTRDDMNMHRSLEHPDSEEKAEEDHLTALTMKYSQLDDEDEVMIVDQQNTPRVAEDSSLAQAETEEKAAAEQRRAQIEADLLEISRIIESKEELISQLQCSQAKYSSMKEFYEGKLQEMEHLLQQKEEERLKIIDEMERLKENNHDTKELEEQLKKNEAHIVGIRKQRLQLKDLTAVSSKNAAEINKLQSDVRSMKERKVIIQKQQVEERKAHAREIKRLKQEVLQKDRESRKWQRISNQKTSEAEKANHMAKAKVQQLGQLREKYKDAEKTIRMLQIKKGVMKKAGLDSVIVGRRGKGTNSKDQSRDPSHDGRSIDTDALRDYFDAKVAEVGRKESLADKLARGWEEHLQLTLKRSELVENETEESKQEIQALDLRIQYEEDRIRKLAHRLGKRQASGLGDEKLQVDHATSILYGRDFKHLCNGVTPAKASELAAKVLFGMVVRERRRIASLAKTASTLDEKLQECQMDNEAKEVAFRSYVQDSQQDLANISMNHQEQILSLMSLVKNTDDDDNSDHIRRVESLNALPTGVDASVLSDHMEGSKLLVLANERIAVLEQQLRELKGEIRVGESYRVEKEEFKASLEVKTAEYEKLEIRIAGLRSTLRHIREELRKAEDGSTGSAAGGRSVNDSCLALIREALLDSPGPLSPMARRHSCPNIFQPASSPQTQKQWEFIQGADDDEEEEEEAPDWADEIMEDLAFIAEGRMPPSLQGVEGLFDTEIQEEEEKKSVYEPPPDLARVSMISSTERHAGSPPLGFHQPADEYHDNFLADNYLVDTLLMADSDSAGNEQAATAVVGHSSDFAVDRPSSSLLKSAGTGIVKSHQLPEDIPAASYQKSASTVRPQHHDEADRSVFDRLVNPTNFTGTQKEKHHASTETQKEHQDISAERLLDSLLESQRDIFAHDATSPAPAPRLSEASTKSNAIESGSKVKAYTRQNVFERLQKTTTQSFAGKHAPTHAHESADALHEASQQTHTTAAPPKPETGKTAKSGAENRMKRAAAQHSADSSSNPKESPPLPSRIQSPSRSKLLKPKVNNLAPSPSRLRSPGRAKSPAKTRKDDYTQQNVFERLTKTTTEAYAVKKRVVKNN